MYFLNQFISYVERLLFKNISIKLKHQKVTSHLYFTVFLEVSFPAFSNQGRYATSDPGPFEEWTKYGRGAKNKNNQTYSKTSEKLCCQSNTAT